MLPPAPRWAVPVRVPFVVLCSPELAILRLLGCFHRGALVSPLDQNSILQKVRRWRGGRHIDSEKSRRRLHYLAPDAAKPSWRRQLRNVGSKACSEALTHLPKCFCAESMCGSDRSRSSTIQGLPLKSPRMRNLPLTPKWNAPCAA
jgi:hypothetical protein